MRGPLFFFIGLALSAGPASADCQSQASALASQVNQVQAQAASLGICQAARDEVSLFNQAANLARQCPSLDPDGSVATAYRGYAQQAQATADASCN